MKLLVIVEGDTVGPPVRGKQTETALPLSG